MLEFFAGYLAFGLALLVGWYIWNRKLPHGAFEWAFAVVFVFLYPGWFAFLIKERFNDPL